MFDLPETGEGSRYQSTSQCCQGRNVSKYKYEKIDKWKNLNERKKRNIKINVKNSDEKIKKKCC